MLSIVINSIGLRGMKGYIVKVEVKVINGLGSFTIVGLPDTSVKESKQRVMATLFSIENSNLFEKKIFINLSPSEQKKNGPFFDLAIAIGIVHELGLFSFRVPNDTVFLGALSLDGTIQPIEAILPALLAARDLGIKKIICPYHPSLSKVNFEELEIIFVQTFEETIHYLTGKTVLKKSPFPVSEDENHFDYNQLNFSKIIGHNKPKRGLEIAATGGHHVLMSGPPGCGKSLLAEHFPSILPQLGSLQQLEVLSLYQLAAVTKPSIFNPPFRQPHHSSSAVSLIGGGSVPKPGEISLAHNGILFLDEMAEFSKKSLDMLRQPLESGKVTISRALSTVTYPARIILIAALNPCPCGYRHSLDRFCLCSPKQILAYRRKLSGPILDRFDIFLNIKSVDMEKESSVKRENSSIIKDRVTLARKRQFERYGDGTLNSYVSTDNLLKSSPINARQERDLQKLAFREHLSTRAQIKLIRLARTISDLDGKDTISDEAIEEAIRLRKEDLF